MAVQFQLVDMGKDSYQTGEVIDPLVAAVPCILEVLEKAVVGDCSYVDDGDGTLIGKGIGSWSLVGELALFSGLQGRPFA